MKPKKGKEEPVYQEDKALEVKKNNAAAIVAPVTSMEDWGVEASSEDLVIPKLMLCQPMSDKVTAGDAAFGDIRDSLENVKYADFKTPLQFVPFFLQRKWVEYKLVPKPGSHEVEKVYTGTVPLVTNPRAPGYNDKLAYEEIINGEKIQRDRVLDFYVLILDQIKEGGIPHVISFRRSSMKAGKALYTQSYVKNIAAGKTPASFVMELSVKKESNDKGTFGVMEVKSGREITPEEMASVTMWLGIIKAGKVKVDESDLAEDTESRNVATNSDGDEIPF